MTDNIAFKATCACGACSITVSGRPVINAVCHCADCKRRTGSAFGWSAYFPKERVTATIGAFRTYSPPGKAPGSTPGKGPATGDWQERVFCGTCGTTLGWRSSDFEGLVGIAGGCIADPPLPEPDVTVRDETRCAWVTLPQTWRTEL